MARRLHLNDTAGNAGSDVPGESHPGNRRCPSQPFTTFDDDEYSEMNANPEQILSIVLLASGMFAAIGLVAVLSYTAFLRKH